MFSGILFLLLLAILVCAIVAGQRSVERTLRTRIAAAARIGDVDLHERMSLRDLKALLGSPDSMDKWESSHAWAYYWGHDLVLALVAGDRNNQRFYSLETISEFRGSFCGVHIGDTLEKAKATLLKRYPAAKILTRDDHMLRMSLGVDSRWEIELLDTEYMHSRPRANMEPGCVAEMCLHIPPGVPERVIIVDR